MQNHLPLTPDCPADQQQQQRWEQQQQQQEQAHSAFTTSSSSKAGAGQAHGLAPEGAAAAVGSAAPAGRDSGALGGFNRAESLVDHLAADENLILADEQQGAGSSEATAGSRSQQPVRAHSLDHDRALEQVRLVGCCSTTGGVPIRCAAHAMCAAMQCTSATTHQEVQKLSIVPCHCHVASQVSALIASF